MRGSLRGIPPLAHEVIREEVLPFLHQPGISTIYGYSRWSLVNAQLWWFDIPSSRRSLTARENALERAYYSGKFLETTPRVQNYHTQLAAAKLAVGNNNPRRAAKLQHRQRNNNGQDKEKYLINKESKLQEDSQRLNNKEKRLHEEAKRQCAERGWLNDERARLAQEESRLYRWSHRLEKMEERLNQVREQVSLVSPDVEHFIFKEDEPGSVQLVNGMEGPSYDFNNYRPNSPNPFGNNMH